MMIRKLSKLREVIILIKMKIIMIIIIFIEIKMIKFLSSTQRGSGEKPSHSLHTLWHTVASSTFGKDDHDDDEHDGNNINMEKMENIQKCFFLFFNRGDISGEKLQKCNLALFPLCSRITALIPQSFWSHCKHPYNLTILKIT